MTVEGRQPMSASTWQALREALLAGASLSDEQALSLAQFDDTASLASLAAQLRDRRHGNKDIGVLNLLHNCI